MNINDLAPGSYTAVPPPTAPQATPQAAPQGNQPLNINSLPQGSYTPAQPAPSLGGFVGNAIGSVGNLVGGAASAIGNSFNPNPDQNTLVNLGRGIAGVGEQALNAIGGTNLNDKNTQVASNIENFYNQRYGISDLATGNIQGALQKITNTLYTDPAGAAADLSMLLTAGGSAASAIGDAGEAGAAADAVRAGSVLPMGGSLADGTRVATPALTTASKVGDALTSAGETLNPFNLLTKPVAALGQGFSGMQDALEQANLRLTPTQATNLGSKVNNITSFISDNLPIGSPEGRYGAITNITNNMEDTLQATLRDNPNVAALTVPKAQVIAQLEALPEAFKDDPASYPLAKRQIAEAAKAIDETQPDEIPLSQLNKIKRSYSGNAFDQLGVKLKSEVKLAISSVPRTLIEDTLKNNSEEIALPTKLQPLFGGAESVPIKQFNKVYGTVLDTKTFLKLAANKAESGLVGRALSGTAGAAVGSVMGGPIGAAVGAGVGEGVASRFATPLRSIAGKAASGVGNILVKTRGLATPALIAQQAGNANRQIRIKKP